MLLKGFLKIVYESAGQFFWSDSLPPILAELLLLLQSAGRWTDD